MSLLTPLNRRGKREAEPGRFQWFVRGPLAQQPWPLAEDIHRCPFFERGPSEARAEWCGSASFCQHHSRRWYPSPVLNGQYQWLWRHRAVYSWIHIKAAWLRNNSVCTGNNPSFALKAAAFPVYLLWGPSQINEHTDWTINTCRLLYSFVISLSDKSKVVERNTKLPHCYWPSLNYRLVCFAYKTLMLGKLDNSSNLFWKLFSEFWRPFKLQRCLFSF